jgi:prepilin-type N-terminal cleavage/methylation domain-containing protein
MNRDPQEGFGLVEVLIALAILSVSIAAVTTKVKQAQILLAESSRLMALDALEASIIDFQQDPRVLNYSVQKGTNAYLKSCILQLGTCISGRGFALDLYRTGDSQAMTGMSVRYDAQGAPCQTTDCKSTFSYRTIVFPSCALTTTCSGPDFVLIRTDVLRVDRSPPKLVRSLVREVERYRDKKFPQLQLTCPNSGEVLRGIGLGGQALCVPLASLVYRDAKGDILNPQLSVTPRDCQSFDASIQDQHFLQAIGSEGALTCAPRFW